MKSKDIVFIVGPTAVGKSAVALALAERLKGEIISCDSMQIYKEIEIASSKPTLAQRKRVPHHLVDVASVTEEFDVAHFSKLVNEAVKVAHGREAMPIVVGGSGLYMQILLDGIFEGKGKNEDLRQELKRTAEAKGVAFLYKKLVKVDPSAAAKMHANDERRIIRALEVYESAKQPISTLQKNREGLWGKYAVRLFGLRQDREELYARINSRVDAMFGEGLVAEINKIKDLPLSLTAQHLIGVKEVLSYLKGETSIDMAKDQLKQNTRHLAKKQMTWFRKEKRIDWIDVTSDNRPAQVAEKIMERLARS
jgi:tRNA dimethylallyltransferase